MDRYEQDDLLDEEREETVEEEEEGYYDQRSFLIVDAIHSAHLVQVRYCIVVWVLPVAGNLLRDFLQ